VVVVEARAQGTGERATKQLRVGRQRVDEIGIWLEGLAVCVEVEPNVWGRDARDREARVILEHAQAIPEVGPEGDGLVGERANERSIESVKRIRGASARDLERLGHDALRDEERPPRSAKQERADVAASLLGRPREEAADAPDRTKLRRRKRGDRPRPLNAPTNARLEALEVGLEDRPVEGRGPRARAGRVDEMSVDPARNSARRREGLNASGDRHGRLE
jgi:hypothetical protein